MSSTQVFLKVNKIELKSQQNYKTKLQLKINEWKTTLDEH